jgi:signal transduction histidine kinase
MAKLESGKFQIEILTFNLIETLTVIHRGLSLRAEEKGIGFHLTIHPSVPTWVKGDPTRLKQIISNLVSNAIKFTEAGEVELKVKASELNNSELIFEVVDSGIGIDEHKLATIFEYFVQEDSSITRRYGGTGLGLAISRSLAEQLQRLTAQEKGPSSLFACRCPKPKNLRQRNNSLLQLSTALKFWWLKTMHSIDF